MKINLDEVLNFFKEKDNFHILAHSSPDGDTLGSSFALYYALTKIGKNVNVFCGDEIPKKYNYILKDYKEKDFKVETVVSVDTADISLLGSLRDKYNKIDLSIDHHASGKLFAEKTYLKFSSSTCENILEIILGLNIELDKNIANALYTGIITDTGRFMYESTSPNTHKAAAILLNYTNDYEKIAFIHFEKISKEYIKLQSLIFEKMEFYFNNNVVFFTVTKEMLEKSGSDYNEIDSIAAISKNIDGVDIGITIKEKNKDIFKISVRTSEKYKADKICKIFGGGGHVRAAGCTIEGNLESVKEKILSVLTKFINV